ncbi:hypothetical protein GVN20_25380 [Runella sp. CRIBMP]|uniref:hypothetical protein n=1 Tax=Runella sp. CRIBMP TaxID=2683261 RepID=UPI0014130081|nr:hypothetical protein [Runella sp. CRIBMP]NBB22713.1 hypothetical protein [Runella sp. CRIBMP]
MKYSVHFLVLLFLFSYTLLRAQDNRSSFQIEVPTEPNWNWVSEGSRLEFTLKTSGGKGDSVTFVIMQGLIEGMSFDSTGHFAWVPSYDLADRTNTQKNIQVIFEARNNQNETTTRSVELKVFHVNRPPRVEDLKPFYVQNRTQNVYKIDANTLKDDDSDPLVIIPVTETLPEGAKLSSAGELTWQPSLTQFNNLKSNPIFIDFFVEDQPAKARAKGRLKIEATQMDLPPSIIQIPKGEYFKSKENATINLKFFLSDPNGDDDIATFDLVTDNPEVPGTTLVQNTPNQYEFIWTPTYDFVKDPYDSLSFQITFFVIDKEQNRDERKVRFTILNAVNEAEKDRQLYDMYRAALVEAWNLVTQLSEKEQELKRSYLKAKKGKKNRSMVNAGLGATTGLSPAVIKTPQTKSIVSAVGGTTIVTISSLEAAEVIGKPLRDLLDRYNYVLEKKIEIQNKGDVFAREYALKAARRQPDYAKKRDEFKAALSIKGLVTLDLDAGWENKKEATDKAIGRAFKDFTPLESQNRARQ